MDLKLKHFVIFITLGCIVACGSRESVLSRITGKQIQINNSLPPSDSINAFIAPYREHLDQILDSVLAYAPWDITREQGAYNTSEGNLLADIVLEQAEPVFKTRTNHSIDMAVLNYGGIRSIISKGKVTSRTAYEVMPFENAIVVVELSGKVVRNMISFLAKSSKPHPFSGLQIILDNEGKLQSVNIQGKPFNETRHYYVATSDYLLSGGDNMVFFKDNLGVTKTDYYIRNAMIDYFKRKDTIAPVIDSRFIQLK